MSTNIIAALNELLEAERTGVEICGKLKNLYSSLGRDLERIEKDEGWACAGLHRLIQDLGGAPSSGKGDFADKVMALPTLVERLQLLARGQQWVIRRVDTLLEEKELNSKMASFLQEMREAHRRNVEWCQRQAQLLNQPA